MLSILFLQSVVGLIVVLYPANGSSAVAESGKASPAKSKKQSSQKKDGPPVTSSVTIDKKSINHPLEKERKKDPPPQRMQFDDHNRVEKAKKRALVNQTEARNRVELFRHLPQYEHGNQLPNLESRLFQLDSMHPAVFKVLFLKLFFSSTKDHKLFLHVTDVSKCSS
jgi:translation initiation factor eIF-2B subunit delta